MTVSRTTRKLSQGDRMRCAHDPDYRRASASPSPPGRAHLDQWREETWTDADKGVEVAFQAVAVDSDTGRRHGNGFNGRRRRRHR
ncbi:hypothetical protein GCM10017687_70690 [Streptomyces echinatus]|uniref:hypothetical protein n=1 Tax=Streptomyces echinatus TaxID=67293 RepID=UPI0031E86368